MFVIVGVSVIDVSVIGNMMVVVELVATTSLLLSTTCYIILATCDLLHATCDLLFAPFYMLLDTGSD